jgi:TrmH family RNA methyltransferase
VIGVYRRDDLPSAAARPVTLALWRVADPGNVGALIRAADAFGAAVALSDGCADPTGPKALRASAGSIWRVPLLPFAAQSGRRVALVAHGGEPLGQVDLRGEATFLVGAERDGLPAELERDVDARIPIGGPNAGAESLNAAVAGSIALYEWRRQNGEDSGSA